MSDSSLQENKILFESTLILTTPVKLLKLSDLHVVRCIVFCSIFHLDELTPFVHSLLPSTSRILYLLLT